MRKLVLLSAVALLACGGEPSASAPPAPKPPDGEGFVDRAADAGFTFVNRTGRARKKEFIVEAKGGGALILDHDGDGDMDVYVVDGNSYRLDDEGQVLSRKADPEARNRLMRNDGHWWFTDVTEEAGVGDRSYGFGGAVGDVDSDGDPDLFVTNWGRNVLYRNDGDGTFTDVTEAAGVAGGDDDFSTGAAFLDVDGDGDLDLYVCNAYRVGQFTRAVGGRGRNARWRRLGAPARAVPPNLDLLYLNRGDGTFVDATAHRLVEQEPRFGSSVIVADVDNDGDPDVYVGNDVDPNTLWVNDGKGRFEDRGDLSGVALDEKMAKQASHGLAAADYDRDGFVDLFATSFSHDKNTLYRNMTPRAKSIDFDDATERAGIDRADFFKTCFGAGFRDLDHDGALDLFMSAGHVYPEIDEFAEFAGTRYRQLSSLWLGTGPPDWHFEKGNDTVGGPGLAKPVVGRGAAFADLDDDGDVDVVVACLNDRPLLLENRLTKKGSWLMLDLVGGESGTEALGARVTVTAGGIRQMREKRRCGSFLSSSDPRLHFGLGNVKRVEKLEVRWPGGAAQTFTDLEANRLYRLVEGGEPEPLR
jgi:hypothetical protein